MNMIGSTRGGNDMIRHITKIIWKVNGKLLRLVYIIQIFPQGRNAMIGQIRKIIWKVNGKLLLCLAHIKKIISKVDEN